MDLRIEGRTKNERNVCPTPLGEGYTCFELTKAH